ncbi:MAG TPA: 5'-methylthioadenosine/S-adenosylhomocysteine nucleosidase [Kofleriaceae bacterium]|nr:5'-methylthioadenosine/S-adenosylhomocysteine nucleosidase [Kofleriaceae bacterium]
MRALLVIALAACQAGVAPAPPPPRVVVEISARAEWRVVARALGDAEVYDTPFGGWLRHRIGNEDVVFFHGGFGKLAAAAATQYAIDRWRPQLLVNLGTCGGFGGERKVGDLVLASETIVYDAIERMNNRPHAVDDFNTKLDLARWPARLADRVVETPLISGDQDLDPAAVATLHATYHASAGDWESGAVAFTAAHNHTPVLVLRGVTDLVDATGDVTYNAPGAWEQETARLMPALIAVLSEALPDLLR